MSILGGGGGGEKFKEISFFLSLGLGKLTYASDSPKSSTIIAFEGLLSAEFVLLLLSLGSGEVCGLFSKIFDFDFSMLLFLLAGVLLIGFRLDQSSTGGVFGFSLACVEGLGLNTLSASFLGYSFSSGFLPMLFYLTAPLLVLGFLVRLTFLTSGLSLD